MRSRKPANPPTIVLTKTAGQQSGSGHTYNSSDQSATKYNMADYRGDLASLTCDRSFLFLSITQEICFSYQITIAHK